MEIIKYRDQNKNLGFEIRKLKTRRIQFVVYSDSFNGWISCYKENTTLHEIIVKEIKALKTVRKKNKKRDKSMDWLVLELQKERVNESQLTLF
jgi:hypothetical protein